jgi:hypothetical protein
MAPSQHTDSMLEPLSRPIMASTLDRFSCSTTNLAILCRWSIGGVRNPPVRSLSSNLDANTLAVMHQQAGNVMKHLETKREAAERRRVALMSKGIATFLERTSQENELNSDDTMSTPEDESRNPNYDQSSDLEDLEITNENTNPGERKPSTSPKESILDKIRMTLDYAADILRESLELTVGGVVFLDTTVGYMETGNVDAYLDPDTDLGAQVQQSGRELTTQEGHKADYLRPALQQCRHLSQGSIRSSEDKYKASKVLSMSAAKIATWDPQSRVLDGKTLQSLINSYPKGNVWYLDDEGYFSSLEQINEYEETAPVSPSGRRRSISPFNATKQNSEAALLSRIFHKARQIIFLPLWDAGGGQQALEHRKSHLLTCSRFHS